jgi:chromosome segregation ATPase
MTDFDVHVEDSTKSYQNVQSLIAISGELIKSGAADLSDVTNIITADSITELKRNIDKSVERKKEENNIISQLQQQVQQYEQAHKDWQKSSEAYENRIKDLERRLEKNNESKLQLESQRIANEKERIENDKSYNDKMVDLKKQQVEAQVAEMYDGNPYNNKVKTVI